MDTIVTSVPEKLPESVRGLLEETRPLPPGVAFFEQHYTASTLLRRVLIAAVLGLVAVALIFSSFEFLYLRHVDPKYQEFINFKEFAAGAVFAFGAWLMLSSVGEGRALIRRQAAGERTRHGIFLTPEALVCRSQFDTTVIPRENFRGLNGGSVNYLLKDAPNSFTLPTEWVGALPAEVSQAITVWQQAAPSQA